MVSARAGRLAPTIDMLAMHHNTIADVIGGIVPESDYEFDGERIALRAHCAMPVATFADKPPWPPGAPAAAARVVSVAEIRTPAPTAEEVDQWAESAHDIFEAPVLIYGPQRPSQAPGHVHPINTKLVPYE